MFYMKGRCAFCGEGVVSFYRGADGALMLLCDECELAWHSPEDVSEAAAIRGPEHTFPDGRWASFVEIEERGWAPYVEGEARSYRD
jgi:hypothetical protein